MDGIFLDTETNGLNFSKHRIVEIAFKIIDLLTGEVKEQFQSIITMSEADWTRSDPVSLQINGFTWEEVAKGITAEKANQEIVKLFTKAMVKRGQSVFICQNPSFDRYYFSQLIDPDLQEKLSWPYHWLDLASMYWCEAMRQPQRGYPWETGFTKDKIAATHQLPSESYPHRAMNGVDHLILCYEAVVGFPNKH